MSLNFHPNSCLVLVDIQKDYKDVFGYQTFKSNVIKLIKEARKQNRMVCFVYEKDIPGKSQWIPFYEELSGPRKLDKGEPFNYSTPKKGDHFIIKHGYDGFFNTGLHSLLQKKGIETIYVAGLLTGVCVLNTVFTGFNLGYRIHLVENCCSDRTKSRHDSTVKNYRNYLFIKESI